MKFALVAVLLLGGCTSFAPYQLARNEGPGCLVGTTVGAAAGGVGGAAIGAGTGQLAAIAGGIAVGGTLGYLITPGCQAAVAPQPLYITK